MGTGIWADVPDSALVEAAVGGDRAAFAAIYERYADPIYGYCRSLLRSDADAADASQDTFVSAAEHLHALRDSSKLRSWLFAVARNAAMGQLRSRGRVESMAAMTEPVATDAGISKQAEQVELVRLVWDAADGLDDRDREILELSVRQGLDGRELADALGIAPAHAYVALQRVRERVERSLGAFLVARLGRDDCGELAALLRDWDGRFSVLIRKRVARHVDRCDVCRDSKRRLASPLQLLAFMPLVPLPVDARERIGDTALTAFDHGAQPTPSGWRGDGFPPLSTGSAPRHRRLLRVAAIAFVIVLAAALFLVSRDDSSPEAVQAIDTVTTSTVVATSASSTTSSSVTTTMSAAPAPSQPEPGPQTASGAPDPDVVTPPPSSTTTSTSTSVRTVDPTAPPVIAGVGARPDTVYRPGSVPNCTLPTVSTVVASVTDDSAVDHVDLVWTNSGVPGRKAMAANGPTYTATLGPFGVIGTVPFHVEAVDDDGATATSPERAITVKPC